MPVDGLGILLDVLVPLAPLPLLLVLFALPDVVAVADWVPVDDSVSCRCRFRPL